MHLSYTLASAFYCTLWASASSYVFSQLIFFYRHEANVIFLGSCGGMMSIRQPGRVAFVHSLLGASSNPKPRIIPTTNNPLLITLRILFPSKLHGNPKFILVFKM